MPNFIQLTKRFVNPSIKYRIVKLNKICKGACVAPIYLQISLHFFYKT